MPLTKVQLKTPHLVLYIESDMGIVFNQIKQSLYQLSAISISILLSIDEGLTKKQVFHQVANLSQLDEKEIDDSYAEVSLLFSQDKGQSSYDDGIYPEILTVKKTSSVTCPNSRTVQIADATFSIFIDSSDLFFDLSILLTPCEKHLLSVDFQLKIYPNATDETLFDISCNDLVVENNLPYNHVVPHLIDRLQILSYQSTDYMFCFHGAALESEYGCLLLPGVSGAGKSTLSCALANKQYSLYSDEMIVLDKFFNVLTLNLPIAIKSGSWSTIALEYPHLSQEKVWQREDGRLLKYIWPKQFVKAKKYTSNKTMLINPCFQKGHVDVAEQVVKLSLFETIQLITDGGYQISSELTVDKVEQLFSFISASQNYKLSYNSTANALMQLEILWYCNQ
jgi:hypothetical protein